LTCLDSIDSTGLEALKENLDRKGVKNGMTRLALLLVFMALPCRFAMAATAEDFKGILIDEKCSGKADLRISGATGLLEGGRIVAEAHTRECLLMPECVKSGYGVYTSDNKFLKFDEAGNRKALALIKASTKLDDFEVEVLGEVNGDSIKVVSLKLLP
jgi:hypothetical protein